MLRRHREKGFTFAVGELREDLAGQPRQRDHIVEAGDPEVDRAPEPLCCFEIGFGEGEFVVGYGRETHRLPEQSAGLPIEVRSPGEVEGSERARPAEQERFDGLGEGVWVELGRS